MSIADIALRTRDNPTLTMKEINTLLTELKNFPFSKRMESTQAGTGSTNKFPDDRYINVKFTQSYVPFSIFTIQNASRGFYPPIATPGSKLIADPDLISSDKGQVYVTNAGRYAPSDSQFDCFVLGAHRPHRIRYYAQDSPTVGDRLHPVDGESYLEKANDGLFVAVSEPNTDDNTIWVVKDSGVGISVENFELVELQECLHPGENATAHVLEPSDFDWVEQNPVEELEIYDPLDQNMLLFGERVWVRTRYVNDIRIGEIVGSHGLFRPARCSNELTCGDGDTVTIYAPRTDQSGSPCKELIASNCTVFACYNWAGTRVIRPSEDFWIKYNGEGQWNVIAGYYPRWVRGQLNADNCGVSPAFVQINSRIDGCTALPEPNDVTAQNPLKKAGMTGDEVIMVEDESGNWIVMDITLHQTIQIEEIRYQDCKIQAYRYNPVLSYICDQPGWDDQIQLYSQPLAYSAQHLGQDASNPERCEDWLLRKNYCLFEDKTQASADSAVQIASYDPKFVLQDWFVSGLTIYGIGLNVYVRCWDIPTAVVLHTGTDCSSGSGQGGSQEQQ